MDDELIEVQMTPEQLLQLYSEWLDGTGLMKDPDPSDQRSHEELAAEFLDHLTRAYARLTDEGDPQQ